MTLRQTLDLSIFISWEEIRLSFKKITSIIEEWIQSAAICWKKLLIWFQVKVNLMKHNIILFSLYKNINLRPLSI